VRRSALDGRELAGLSPAQAEAYVTAFEAEAAGYYTGHGTVPSIVHARATRAGRVAAATAAPAPAPVPPKRRDTAKPAPRDRSIWSGGDPAQRALAERVARAAAAARDEPDDDDEPEHDDDDPMCKCAACLAARKEASDMPAKKESKFGTDAMALTIVHPQFEPAAHEFVLGKPTKRDRTRDALARAIGLTPTHAADISDRDLVTMASASLQARGA
jgi:hypothetical protein